VPRKSAADVVTLVVVAKLDANRVADITGDVPQHVTFAIRGEIAKLFLSQNGVDPELSLDSDPLPPETLAEQARGFTTFVECN
jgi:serine protease Do